MSLSDQAGSAVPDLDAIEVRANAARGDWWEWDGRDIARCYGDRDDPATDTLLCYRRLPTPDTEAMFRSDADADFIAHSREDVPALIAHIRALRAEVARLRAALAGTQEVAP